MLNHLPSRSCLPTAARFSLSAVEHEDGLTPGHARANCFDEFRLEDGLPVWRTTSATCAREARAAAAPARTPSTSLPSARRRRAVRLKLRPAVHFRPHDAARGRRPARPVRLTAVDEPLRAGGRRRPAAAAARGPRRTGAPSPSTATLIERMLYRVEAGRGYDSLGALWSPGYFRVELAAGQPCHAGRLDRAVGDDPRADAGRGGRGGARGAAAWLLAQADPRAARRASAASWCWPPTSSSSRRRAAPRTPRARTPPATRCAP